MGKPTGFLEVNRELPEKRSIYERIKDYEEIYRDFPEIKVISQASRCMNCGVAFCHNNCPLGNMIPEFNDLVYNKRWEEALNLLHSTNNFPEITGRVCPALCEASCVLSINDEPVTVQQMERRIIDKGFKEGLIKPFIPPKRTGKKVAVIGSGPAGLSAAQQLNRAGHTVTIFEKEGRCGGLLLYGIPDYKLPKWIVDRRIYLLREEEITFKTKTEIGSKNFPAARLKKEFNAILLAGGALHPRDLDIKGRDLKGIYFALDFLKQQNIRLMGHNIEKSKGITASGKNVIVIGGGDTGADCAGISIRQGAKSVTQFEIMPKPPETRSSETPWPIWPYIIRQSSVHEEGTERHWSIMTKEFTGKKGNVTGIKAVRVKLVEDPDTGNKKFVEIKGSEFELKAELILLAMGFTGPLKKGMLDQFKVKLDKKGNVKIDSSYMTNIKGIFSAGDMRRGPSLVVRAIADGRNAAKSIDKFLMGNTIL